MTALAGIHRVDPATTAYLGAAVSFEDDVTRWDSFFERAADPGELAGVPAVRKRLLQSVPQDAPVGVYHGDFQTANLFCTTDVAQPRLLAVIDWELTGIGATLNDLGWICTFSDRAAWDAESRGAAPMFLDPDTLTELYVEALGSRPAGLEWFRALAAYKFAIITGFNLSLHRRGKRVDDTWETTRLSMRPLLTRALELLN
jgi:aminoglycoside phosphotransferase (APT) family kinase protein